MRSVRAVCLNVVNPIPVGIYSGIWGGSKVEVVSEGAVFFLETEVSVKGFDIPVSIMVSEVGISVVEINQ